MTSTALVPTRPPSGDPAGVEQLAQAVLSHHARSFRWGQFFLPPDVADEAAVVYAFCREADDAVDEAADPEAGAVALQALRAQFEGRSPRTPLVERFCDIVERRQIPKSAVQDLLDGIAQDTGPVTIQDDGELLRYCYRVAGTVGVLMCGVLRVTDREAIQNAIDLGVAMQLTNICRDVREDLDRDRVYLPKTRLDAFGPDAITGPRAREAVRQVVRDLLAMADRYYESGFRGLRAIPARGRLAIVVAAELYRAIGHQLRRNGGDALAGRTVVGPVKKLWLVGRSLVRYLFLPARARHQRELHAAFHTLLPR